MKFQIRITETLERIIDVEATDESEAMAIAHKEYEKESIVLDWNDFTDVSFTCVGGCREGEIL